MGALKRWAFGTPEEYKQIPRFKDNQVSALDNFLSQGRQYSDIQGQEDLARKRFAEDTMPLIMSRFGKFGGSSALENAVGRAGSDLEAQLRAMRGQYGLRMAQMGLTPQFNTQYKPETMGFFGEDLPAAALQAAVAWAGGGFKGLGGSKKPKQPNEMFPAGIGPGDPGYEQAYGGDTYEDLTGRRQTMPENPVFNQLFSMKQAAKPSSRYADLFNTGTQRRPYSATDEPILAGLLGNPGVGNYNPMMSPFTTRQPSWSENVAIRGANLPSDFMNWRRNRWNQEFPRQAY